MGSEDIMNGSGNGKGVLVAAIVGAAVGAGVALLFAPCSGKETRGWLASQRKSMTRSNTQLVEDVMNVQLDCSLADEEFLRDRPIRDTQTEEFVDLALSP